MKLRSEVYREGKLLIQKINPECWYCYFDDVFIEEVQPQEVYQLRTDLLNTINTDIFREKYIGEKIKEIERYHRKIQEGE